MSISITLNGSPFVLEAEAGENLRDALRRAGILSVRNGCDGEGTCGNCSILVDGRLMNTCLLVVGQVEGRDLRTVEGLAKPRELSSLQTAFIDAGIVQCGYCTGSMLMAAAELLEKVERPTREQVKDALSGVFCRCTGYEQVFDAMNLAVARRKDPATPVEARNSAKACATSVPPKAKLTVTCSPAASRHLSKTVSDPVIATSR